MSTPNHTQTLRALNALMTKWQQEDAVTLKIGAVKMRLPVDERIVDRKKQATPQR